MRPIRSEADLDAMRRNNQAYMMVSAWAAAGLFDALADGRLHPLSALPGNERALQIGATVLGHLGLLQTDGSRWGMSVVAMQLYQEGALRMSPHQASCESFASLPTVLQEGTAVQETDIGVVESDPARVQDFMDYLYRRSDVPAAHSAASLKDWLEPGAKVLDLGGGHGRYAKAFVDEGFQATLFDKGICVDIARARHGQELDYIAGDFHKDELGGPYDAIFLSNIVHGLDEESNQALVDRLVGALAPGGFLVVKDFFAEGSGMQPEGAVVFGMVMLMFTQGGRTYTLGEMQDMMALAGLHPAEIVHAPDQGYELVVGRRLA